jgi:hypothetical protein
MEFVSHAYNERLTELFGSDPPAPALKSANQFARRSTGAALTSFHLNDARQIRPDLNTPSGNVVELEVHEDGGLRIFMGRLSDYLQSADEHVLLDQHVAIYTRQLIALTVAAAKRAGYLGNWVLAAGATNLRGKYSYEYARSRWNDEGPRYDADTYERVTMASYAELSKQSGAVASRLVGKLLRALGTTSEFAHLFNDPEQG